MSDKVLLTGISGFVAKHVAIELLNSGFEVLGTVRNLNSIEQTKKTLENCEKYKTEPNDENKELVKTSLNKAFSLIDKAVKKNVLHRNNGANRKSKINNFVKTTLTTK